MRRMWARVGDVVVAGAVIGFVILVGRAIDEAWNGENDMWVSCNGMEPTGLPAQKRWWR